jgi:hypothetical protein
MKNRPTPATEWTAEADAGGGARYEITMTTVVGAEVVSARMNG